MIENVITDAIRTSVNVTLYGLMVILGDEADVARHAEGSYLAHAESMISFPVTLAPGLSWMKAAGTST